VKRKTLQSLSSERLIPLLRLRVSYLHPPFSFSFSSIPEKLRLRRLFFLAMKRITYLFQEQQEVPFFLEE